MYMAGNSTSGQVFGYYFGLVRRYNYLYNPGVSPRALQLPLGPALDHPSETGIIVLDADLARGFIHARVGLHKHLPRLDVGNDHVPDTGGPEVGIGGSHVSVELGRDVEVRRSLVDVELLEVVLDSYCSRLVLEWRM